MIDEIGHKNRSSQNGLSEAAMAADSPSHTYEPPSDGGFASWEECVNFLKETPRRLTVRHWQVNRRPDDVDEPLGHIELFDAAPYIKRNQISLPDGGHPRGHTYDSRIELAREMEARWIRRLKPIGIGALGLAVVVFVVLAVNSFIDYNNPDTTASREPVAAAAMSTGPDLSMGSLAESGPPMTGIVPSTSTTAGLATTTTLSSEPDPPRTGMVVTPTTTTLVEPEWPKTVDLMPQQLWHEVGTAMVTIRATETMLEDETAIWRFTYPVTMRVSMLRGVQCDTHPDTLQLPIPISLLSGSEASSARIDPRTLPGFEVSTCIEQVNPFFDFQLGVQDPAGFPAQRTLPSEDSPQAVGNQGTIYEPEPGSGSWVVSEPMQTMFIRGYASSQTCLNRARDAMYATIWATIAQQVADSEEGFGLALEPLAGVTFLDVPTVPFAIDPVDLQIIGRTSFVTNFELEAVTC